MFRSTRHLMPLMFFLAILVGCGENVESRILSPSGEYSVLASVQDSIVHVYLSNAQGVELHEVRNGASDFQKWTIGWMLERDTVVLYSSDIGTLAYDVVDGRLLPIENTAIDQEILDWGQTLYANKYN